MAYTSLCPSISVYISERLLIDNKVSEEIPQEKM
jgi:hypothetical protein